MESPATATSNSADHSNNKRTSEDPLDGGLAGSRVKRIACIECRQQKVRCDAHEKYPDSCTRCIKKGLTCVLQPDFKRTYKRRRLVEIEKEIQKLKTTMETGGTSSNGSEPSRPSTLPMPLDLGSTEGVYKDLPEPVYVRERLRENPVTITPTIVTTPSSSSSSSQYLHTGLATKFGHVELDYSKLMCPPKTIGGVTLDTITIANLFKEFVDKYNPFLPVVDVAKGPQEIYNQCPALFWTIMVTASRRYDADGSLMMRLTPVLKQCLSEITVSPTNGYAAGRSTSSIVNAASVYTVQAFLIYTMWPPLTSSLSADSAWNTAGLAMYSAIRLGLHCPGYSRDFGRIKTDNPSYPQMNEQIRTWICCNIVSQSVATVYGYPAFTSFDASVLSACGPDSSIKMAEPIRQLMEIQHFEEEVAKTLNSNPRDPLGLSELSERLSLIQILSRKLDELDMQLEGTMDDCRKFVLLAARVHLLTYYYLDNGGYSEIQLQKGMIKAYNSALALLEHCERTYSADRSFIKYMPGIYSQILWQSSSIICKVYHSHFVQFVDGAAGKQLYHNCIKFISKASILKHDMMYRAAELMQQVWRLFAELEGDRAQRIVVRTRMSASVFFDCLWTLREEVGIRSAAPVILYQRLPVDADNEDEEEQADFKDQPLHFQPQDQKTLLSSPKSGNRLNSAGNTASLESNSINKVKAVNTLNSQSSTTTQPAPIFRNAVISNGSAFNNNSNNSSNNNKTDFFSWDADLIWKDVDSLMTDFGFGEEEAPQK